MFDPALWRNEVTQPGQNPFYMGPKEGPFKCENCEYYSDPNKCYKEEMIKHQKADEFAKVEPEGCCNYFEPGESKLEYDNPDEEDDDGDEG